MKKIYFALYIGCYGGVIWGIVYWGLYALNLSKVNPGFMIEPFVTKSYLESWIGQLIGVGNFVVLSLLVALIYLLLFRKLKGPWPGILYGFAWWIILFVLIAPLTGLLPALWKQDLNSICCEVCILTLWGSFIGYSLTLEYTDERNYEPQSS